MWVTHYIGNVHVSFALLDFFVHKLWADTGQVGATQNVASLSEGHIIAMQQIDAGEFDAHITLLFTILSCAVQWDQLYHREKLPVWLLLWVSAVNHEAFDISFTWPLCMPLGRLQCSWTQVIQKLIAGHFCELCEKYTHIYVGELLQFFIPKNHYLKQYICYIFCIYCTILLFTWRHTVLTSAGKIILCCILCHCVTKQM